MAIESEKNCETCVRRELPKCEYPCCDCHEDNDYKHFKEKDDGSKETVDYLVSMFELINILNEFEKDYAEEPALDFENKEDIKMTIDSMRNCDTCKYGDLSKIQYPCCDCYGDNDYKHFKERDGESKGEEIKMAIESKKNCETCGLKDLDNNMYPCCDCDGRNGYMHWEPQDEENKETVNHPNHYQSSRFEVIDIIDEFGKDYTGESAFDFGNVIKYILRAKKKNGLEDLKKAQWYLNRLIDKWED